MAPLTAVGVRLESGLVDTACGHGHVLFGIDIRNLARLDPLFDGSLQFLSCPFQEALPVTETFVLRIEATVDEIRH
ncbi:hypothetical protein Q1M63_25300 [Sinorhizobium meliloti]|nr:hypothetical protein Q1M63_25300 [Sinorhizobium meliloti]